MAKTQVAPPRSWGWRFHHALDRMNMAYEQARVASRIERHDLEERMDALRSEWDATGPMDEDDRDDIGRQQDHMADEWQDNELILRLITESFLLSLFHFWEKQLKSVMQLDVYDHNAAFGWLKQNGFKPDCRELTTLKYLAETIKHSDGRSAVWLYEMEPSYFDARLVREADDADYDGLLVKEEHFQHFIGIVRTSGPQSRKLFF